MSRMPTSQEEVNATFARLDEALKDMVFTSVLGGERKLKADEFMLMQFGDNNEAQFKHRDTRNYVFLHPTGQLVVPRTDKAFMRGEF